MEEFSTIRNNPMIDPNLHVWGWEIPTYLFLGGIAAGIMIITAWFLRDREQAERSIWFRALPFAAPLLISLGMLSLLMDLELKLHTYRFYLFFRPTSPMSWGAWILMLIYPATLAFGLLNLPDSSLERLGEGALSRGISWLREELEPYRATLRWANLVLGIGLGIYTGILLGSLGARPLWNSAILGPLFLISGVSTAAAFMMLFPVNHQEHVSLRNWDMVAIGAELAVLGLFLLGQFASSSASAQEAVTLFFGGQYTATFWSLVVIGGLLLPLTLKAFEITKGLRPNLVTPALILVGGFALRWIFVAAGQVRI